MLLLSPIRIFALSLLSGRCRRSVTLPASFSFVSLKDRGVIIEKEIENKTNYCVNDIDDIEEILKKEIEKRDIALKQFKVLKKEIKFVETKKAKVRFFETRESLYRTLRGTLFAKSKITYGKVMIKILKGDTLMQNKILIWDILFLITK